MNLKIFMIKLLRELRISPKHLGDLYLQTCCYYVYENINSLKSLSRLVYPILTQKFLSSEKGVEKAIRNAIDKAYIRGGMKISDSNRCPTNKEVISFVVGKMIEQEYRSPVSFNEFIVNR